MKLWFLFYFFLFSPVPVRKMIHDSWLQSQVACWNCPKKENSPFMLTWRCFTFPLTVLNNLNQIENVIVNRVSAHALEMGLLQWFATIWYAKWKPLGTNASEMFAKFSRKKKKRTRWVYNDDPGLPEENGRWIRLKSLSKTTKVKEFCVYTIFDE